MGESWMSKALMLLTIVLIGAACVEANDYSEQNQGVVVEQEDVCIVGRDDEVTARYCTKLSLKDIGTGEGFLRHLRWLRFENANVLLQGDAVGPLGTRMVISFKNRVGDSKDLNDTSFATASRSDLLAMNLARMELLLKEIVGGEAIGWGSSGPLDLDERVIKSPFKSMVVMQGGVGLGAELEELIPTSFKDVFPDLNAKGKDSEPSTLGLWHWIPVMSSDGKQDSWSSFFSFLGAPAPESKMVKRGRFLPKWLAKRASLWAKELSSSQWQLSSQIYSPLTMPILGNSNLQVLQRSLTLVSPQDKRKSLSLTYCESARTSSPPKCIFESNAANEIDKRSYDIPKDSQLQVLMNSTDLCNCTSSSTGGDESEELWVLQGIQRTLVGNGAHRLVKSVVTVSGPSSSVEGSHKSCHLRLLERLPTGVFADQFELQGIQRRGVVKEAWIHGDINLEQPALLSTQSVVGVCVPLHKIQGNGSDDSMSLLQAEVALPLHARYPPLSLNSHSNVHIPMPHMFVSCQQEDTTLPNTKIGNKWNQVMLGDDVVSATLAGVLDWMVPAGNPADYSFVARFTAITALTGVLVVFASSVSAQRQD